MRFGRKLKINNLYRKFWHNFYLQLWFKYHNLFFGSLIFKGNKLRAFNLFLDIKKEMKNLEFFDPYYTFLVSLMKVTPNIILMPIKLGGSSYGIPMPITESKRITFGIKWILKLLKDKNYFLSSKSIADILIASLYNKGFAIDKKHSLYRISSLNRHLFKFYNN